jgi:hypothetical protein
METISFMPLTTNGRNKRSALDFTMTQIARTVAHDDLISMTNSDLDDLFGSHAATKVPFFGTNDELDTPESMFAEIDDF